MTLADWEKLTRRVRTGMATIADAEIVRREMPEVSQVAERITLGTATDADAILIHRIAHEREILGVAS